MSLILARHPRQTRQHATQSTHTSKLSTQAHHPRQHATHTSTPPTQAHHPPHPHQHIPSQARHPRHSRQHKQHAIFQTRCFMAIFGPFPRGQSHLSDLKIYIKSSGSQKSSRSVVRSFVIKAWPNTQLGLNWDTSNSQRDALTH